MKLKPDFEIVNIANDYMLMPVGNQTDIFNGTVVLNDTSAFILEKLKSEISIEGLVNAVISEFDIDTITARNDIIIIIEKLKEIGLLVDE